MSEYNLATLFNLLQGNRTLADMAKELGISVRAISNYKRGRMPQAGIWRRILGRYPAYKDAILATMVDTMKGKVGE
jgi:hypothetical protein